jgi:hypothetical protein
MRWIIARLRLNSIWYRQFITNGLNMAPLETINELIESAAEVAGSQRKLAALLEVNPSNLIEMKQGKRACSWRLRGKMRVILGEDPTRAFVAAMAEDLAASENADEKKAADGFQAMLAAFPSDWRKRMFKTLRGWLGPLDCTLHNRWTHSVFCS